MVANVRQLGVRPAIVVGGIDTRRQTCLVKFTDSSVDEVFTCSLPHPMAGPGWGILATPTVGTRVLINMQQGERPQIVSTIPSNQFSQDFENPNYVGEVSSQQNEYPDMAPGTLALQSSGGSVFCLENDGVVRLSVNEMEVEYSPDFNAVSENFNSRYVNTEAHRSISGPIKRDVRERPKTNEEVFDRLIDVVADRSLTTIGRNPLLPQEVLTVNLNATNESLRNPALVEDHSIVYEFARTHMVQDYAQEVSRLNGEEELSISGLGTSFLFQNDRRDMDRTDVLNLGPHLPNNLIEKVQGTVVDRYGNILDINRRVIDFSELITDEKIKDANSRVNIETALLRRSIKYHFELNARKETLAEAPRDQLDGIPGVDDQSAAIGYSHSRLSFDVDGEGLVKFNIPASSNTGNIPLLSRYVNAYDAEDEKSRNSWKYRPNPRVDIQHMGFGNVEGFGVDIPPEYAPDNILEEGQTLKYRTAYHDISGTADEIIGDQGGTFAVSDSITNTIVVEEGEAPPNAGGRSIHGNLDGSLELNIGRDVVDKKSLVLDMAGGVVARYGKDDRGNSLISQTDGNVLMQVGGDSVRGETPDTMNSFSLYVKSLAGYHKIDLNKYGIFITSAPNTNLVLESSKNLILSSKGKTLLGGENIVAYGKHSNNGDTIEGERLILRSGKEMK